MRCVYARGVCFTYSKRANAWTGRLDRQGHPEGLGLLLHDPDMGRDGVERWRWSVISDDDEARAGGPCLRLPAQRAALACVLHALATYA